jgi:hypothetical protein
MPQSSKLRILGKEGEWLRVEFQDLSGFVLRYYVDFVATERKLEKKVEGTTEERNVTNTRLFGRAKAVVKLRSGPGTKFPTTRILPSNLVMEVIGQKDVWVQIKTIGRTGYIHTNFVNFETREVIHADDKESAQFSTPSIKPGKVVSSDTPTLKGPLEDQPLGIPVSQQLALNPEAPLIERLVVSTWNHYGEFLKAISKILKIDPGTALALLAVETGGRGFGNNGRMIIRFANHVFWEYWGVKNKQIFDLHFRFDPNARWKGHQWRENSQEDRWHQLNGKDQNIEWNAFGFAYNLNNTAARLSISMGRPQIMGFNYHLLGFDSVHDMYEAFLASERNQIICFFDFIKGRNMSSEKLYALQSQDFEAFASLYNGPGKAKKFGKLIKDVNILFQRIQEQRGK